MYQNGDSYKCKQKADSVVLITPKAVKNLQLFYFQWCDGKSANIVWALEASALKALANLSRPISESTDGDDTMSDSVLSPEEQKEKLIAQVCIYIFFLF